MREIRAEFARIKDTDAHEKDGFGWDGYKLRVEAAVERGDLTREEADAKYEEMRLRMHGEKETRSGEFDWAMFERRVEAAVERGDLTREGADAKYREMREKMAAEDRDD